MKTHQDLLDEIVGPSPPEDAFLSRSFFENLIERVTLFLVLLVKNSVENRQTQLLTEKLIRWESLT